MVTNMKTLLTILLALIPTTLLAQNWVRYAESDQSLMYFDSLRTRKMGDTAFVWDLHDLKAPPLTLLASLINRYFMQSSTNAARANGGYWALQDISKAWAPASRFRKKQAPWRSPKLDQDLAQSSSSIMSANNRARRPGYFLARTQPAGMVRTNRSAHDGCTPNHRLNSATSASVSTPARMRNAIRSRR